MCSRHTERGIEHMTGTSFLPRALSASKTVRTDPVLPRASPVSSSQLLPPFFSASPETRCLLPLNSPTAGPFFMVESLPYGIG